MVIRNDGPDGVLDLVEYKTYCSVCYMIVQVDIIRQVPLLYKTLLVCQHEHEVSYPSYVNQAESPLKLTDISGVEFNRR